jgi:hypothetical protein
VICVAQLLLAVRICKSRIWAADLTTIADPAQARVRDYILHFTIRKDGGSMSLFLRRLRGMSSHLWAFVFEVFSHWLSIAGGSLVSLGILIWEKSQRKEVKWKAILTIFLAGLGLSLFFAWQDEYTSAEWRTGKIYELNGLLQGKDAAIQTKDQQIQSLQTQLAEKDRPINLEQHSDPAIGMLLAQLVSVQEKEQSQIKGDLPSPKKKALQVSNDILNFIAERMKVTPDSPLPRPGMTVEQYNQEQSEHERAYLQWMNETAAESTARFAIPIDGVLEDMKAENIDTKAFSGMCEFFNGNTFGLQQCATMIGRLAQQLSH